LTKYESNAGKIENTPSKMVFYKDLRTKSIIVTMISINLKRTFFSQSL